MDDKLSEFERGVADERERVLIWLAYYKEALGDEWVPLFNRIKHGNDPREPDYADDRLMP
jgi:hypothetical protein